jgi:hypothetical protein
MRHNIMSSLHLLDPRDLEVSVANFETTPHLLQRFRRDTLDAELPPALGEVQPQFAMLSGGSAG